MATKELSGKGMASKNGRANGLRHKTKNDIPEKDRTRVIEVLNARLADGIDLYMQTKQAHWNVKGKQFIALHELFDKVAETIEEGIDEIAERAVALGGMALGTLQAVGSATSMAPYPTDISSGDDHVEALSSALAAFGASARKAIETTDEIGDKDTADLFTGISRDVDKLLWMVEAHQQ